MSPLFLLANMARVFIISFLRNPLGFVDFYPIDSLLSTLLISALVFPAYFGFNLLLILTNKCFSFFFCITAIQVHQFPVSIACRAFHKFSILLQVFPVFLDLQVLHLYFWFTDMYVLYKPWPLSELQSHVNLPVRGLVLNPGIHLKLTCCFFHFLYFFIFFSFIRFHLCFQIL